MSDDERPNQPPDLPGGEPLDSLTPPAAAGPELPATPEPAGAAPLPGVPGAQGTPVMPSTGIASPVAPTGMPPAVPGTPPPPGTAVAAGVGLPGVYGGPQPRSWPPPPAPVPPRRRTSAAAWIILALVALAFATLLIGVFVSSQMGEQAPAIAPLSRVGVIGITGIIRDGGRGGFLSGPAGARGIMEQIRDARRDSDVRSVLLLINSPGGSAAASHAIWQEVRRLRERKKVVVCMTDVCASGGYYIASAADKIVADGSTLTGSIGVIMGGMGYYGLMQKLGLTDQTITAGKFKDTGSGARPMSAEEKALLSAMLQDVYSQFIEAVATGRNMKPETVSKLAEGRIYTGRQAQKIGLVDQIGNFYDAVELAGRLGGVRGEPRLKYYGEPRGFLEELTASESTFKRLFGSRGALDETPLQGPMLLMPYMYHMVPAISGSPLDVD